MPGQKKCGDEKQQPLQPLQSYQTNSWVCHELAEKMIVWLTPHPMGAKRPGLPSRSEMEWDQHLLEGEIVADVSGGSQLASKTRHAGMHIIWADQCVLKDEKEKLYAFKTGRETEGCAPEQGANQRVATWQWPSGLFQPAALSWGYTHLADGQFWYLIKFRILSLVPQWNRTELKIWAFISSHWH